MKQSIYSRLSAFVAIIAAVIAISGCSTSRHVPQDKLLLSSLKIEVEGDKQITPDGMYYYLRQFPNYKVLGFAKLSLGIYNMSGSDTTKWYNRWIRRVGQEPVIYDPELTAQSRRQLELALLNRGYNHATVEVDSVVDTRKRKMNLTYRINTGEPHRITTVNYEFDDPAIESLVMADTTLLTVRPGTPLNRDLLENERQQITARLRNDGYYSFFKDYITYVADTVPGSTDVDLTLRVRNPQPSAEDSIARHERYIISRVKFIVEAPKPDAALRDTIDRPGYLFIYDGDHYLRPGLLIDKCFITPGEAYSATDVNRTYEAFSQLMIVKYINIDIIPAGRIDGVNYLDAVITLSRTKKQGVTFEVEGTNSEGDLGFGVGLTYQHRNLAHGAEILTAKFRTSYESLSGNFDGFINDRYTEFSGEVGVAMPKLEAPLLSRSFKRRFHASTEFALSFNYQERPEYTRIISGAAWKYRWNTNRNLERHLLDLVDLNFVYLPKSTIDFINTVAPQNPLLRYSYEDHLIMRIGYSYYRTNRRPVTPNRLAPAPFQPDIYTMRASVETAGNLLYAFSHIVGQKKHDGAYKVFGTQYAQYVKADFDYARVHNLNQRNAIAWHTGFGIGYPYGNSSMIPFEKRFYAGGANSVRGWGVRTLGPGSYDSRNSVTDFINQCGDIRLDLNLEYRLKMFWVVEGALFVDAGNIWTIHSYPNQPGGMFKFNKFYKQIAAAYGLGIRFDFTYFLLRLDLGMKAHNPAQGAEPWPLIHPHWKRDHTLHFSIGYPF